MPSSPPAGSKSAGSTCVLVIADVVLAQHHTAMLGSGLVKPSANLFIAVTDEEKILVLHFATSLLHVLHHELDERRCRKGPPSVTAKGDTADRGERKYRMQSPGRRAHAEQALTSFERLLHPALHLLVLLSVLHHPHFGLEGNLAKKYA